MIFKRLHTLYISLYDLLVLSNFFFLIFLSLSLSLSLLVQAMNDGGTGD